jgi:hypothetical protein
MDQKVHAKRRVARGAAFLDKRYPGWQDQVDLTRLDIDSCYQCVLGQLYGSFTQGSNSLGIGYEKCARMGMDSKGLVRSKEEFPKLTRAWVREIMFRRELAAVLSEKVETKEKVDA